jgi:putative serine/threonine protein kinase
MLESLNEIDHGHLICYPVCGTGEFSRRHQALEQLSIDSIELVGQNTISKTPVLGKGCVGIVVLAYRGVEKVALKIRRTDANRSSMRHEAEMLEKANRISVGPCLLDFTEDFLLMEYVEGMLFPKWIKTLRGRNAKRKLSRFLFSVLEQAWELDRLGLDHGELSHAPKHLMVKRGDEPCILDFETASVSRHVSNVTSLCQYLFIGSAAAKVVQEMLSPINVDALVDALKIYKKKRNKDNFKTVLEICKIRDFS